MVMRPVVLALCAALILGSCLVDAASVKFYSDSSFRGQTYEVTQVAGTTCYNLPSNFQRQATSLTASGVDGIVAFASTNCQGTSVSFFAPVQWLGDIWNDKVVSFQFVANIRTSTPLPPSTTISSGVCDLVLIVDNYVARGLNSTLSSTQMYNKYKSYHTDIDAYYRNNFNIRLNLAYIYIEEKSSFTDVTDGGQLLNEFGNAINQKKFGSSMPSGACAYHLITGRQPPGAAGLAYVGAICGPATGWTVDAQGKDGAGIVLRRAIHEIGHNFNGNHPDAYLDKTPPYVNCSINNDLGVYRILRDTVPVPYAYLEEGATISECATIAMRNSIPAFPCLYKNPVFTSPFTSPAVTFYNDANYGGGTFPVVARYGYDKCYNLMRFSGSVSSFKADSNIVGIVAYQSSDCRGASVTINAPASGMPSGYNDRVNSFRFIVGTTTPPPTPAPTACPAGKDTLVELQAVTSPSTAADLNSPSCRFKLYLQDNSNLQLFDGSTMIWQTGTSSTDAPFRLIMQNDGNLVIYGATGSVAWNTGTWGRGSHPYRATLQNDGNFVVYANNVPLWASNTNRA